MLLDVLDKIKQQTIITSILLMILGLLMIVIPEQYDGILINILGYIVIILGAVMVWDFIASEKKLVNWILFIFAQLLIFLGVFVLVLGNDTMTVLSVLFGILLIVDGFHSAMHAWMYARRSGKKMWGLLLLISILLMVAGLTILNNPWWKTAHSLMKVIGGTLLFAAAAGIFRLVMVWPIRKA